MNRKNNNNSIVMQEAENGVSYFYFPALAETNLVNHGFSTKFGGVSEGVFTSMNLGFGRGDSDEKVLENYRHMADALGVDYNKYTLSHQTHTTNVRQMTSEDIGKGIFIPRDYENVDGMITNESGMVLVTFYADCVPLYFLDPVHKAIGLSHSGWRGTVGRIGACTLEKMKEAYGTKPEDVIACIGPSICGDCYEVGPEVAKEFLKEFTDFKEENGGSSQELAQVLKEFVEMQDQSARGNGVVTNGREGHFQLDLWKANEIVLLEAGILSKNLHITNVCTRCNPDVFYSHRIMGNKRGSLAAFMALK